MIDSCNCESGRSNVVAIFKQLSYERNYLRVITIKKTIREEEYFIPLYNESLFSSNVIIGEKYSYISRMYSYSLYFDVKQIYSLIFDECSKKFYRYTCDKRS